MPDAMRALLLFFILFSGIQAWANAEVAAQLRARINDVMMQDYPSTLIAFDPDSEENKRMWKENIAQFEQSQLVAHQRFVRWLRWLDPQSKAIVDRFDFPDYRGRERYNTSPKQWMQQAMLTIEYSAWMQTWAKEAKAAREFDSAWRDYVGQMKKQLHPDVRAADEALQRWRTGRATEDDRRKIQWLLSVL